MLGQINVGGISSIKFTSNVQLSVFPLPSVAVRVTVVVSDIIVPGGGDWVTFTVPQASLAVASPV